MKRFYSRWPAGSVLMCLAVLGACSITRRSDETSPATAATADPWLRSQAASDCPQAACLFALVVDGNNTPIGNAEVDIDGTGIRVTSDGRGRIVASGIPFGTRRLRVTTSGTTLQSESVALGRVFTSLVIEVQSDKVVLRI